MSKTTTTSTSFDARTLQRRSSESAWTVANTGFLRRASARNYFGDADRDCVSMHKHQVFDLVKDLYTQRARLVNDYAFYADVDNNAANDDDPDNFDRGARRVICIWRITNPRRHTWFRRLWRCGRTESATQHFYLGVPRDGHVVLEEAIPGIDFDVVHALAEKKVQDLAQKIGPCWVTVELT